jgi:hypothetical protein
MCFSLQHNICSQTGLWLVGWLRSTLDAVEVFFGWSFGPI